MATIDLGKIKQVWRGTYNNGTAYAVDDLVEYTDTAITSTYICTTASTGNAPSSGGTAHGSWAYVAKGAGGSPTTTRGDIIRRGASADERLAKGTSGQILTMGSDDPAWAAAPESNWVKLASATITGTPANITIDNIFSTSYRMYKLFLVGWKLSGNKPYLRFLDTSGSAITSDNYKWQTNHTYSSGNSNIHGGNNANRFYLHGDNVIAIQNSFNGEFDIYDPIEADQTFMSGQSMGDEGDGSQFNGHDFTGYLNTNDGCRGIYLYLDGGTIGDGYYIVYGIKM